MADLEMYWRLLVSVLLGGLIGMERQLRHHPAGLRTHILVCLGSCLIMLTSLYVFDIYYTRVALDPVRIAAGVITGIGFLGAGAIMREGEGVKGLTTAASLWVAAAMGLAVGCGFYRAALFTAVLAVSVLVFLKYLEALVFKDKA